MPFVVWISRIHTARIVNLFLLLLICQNLCKMGSCLLTIRREDLTIFLLGQLLTKTKEYFVLNNRKLISIAMCKEPQLFS